MSRARARSSWFARDGGFGLFFSALDSFSRLTFRLSLFSRARARERREEATKPLASGTELCVRGGNKSGRCEAGEKRGGGERGGGATRGSRRRALPRKRAVVCVLVTMCSFGREETRGAVLMSTAAEYSADKSGPARLDVDGLYKGTRATCERRTPSRRRLRFEQRDRSGERCARPLSFSPSDLESELGLADLGLHRARLAPARRVLEARLRARRTKSARGERLSFDPRARARRRARARARRAERVQRAERSAARLGEVRRAHLGVARRRREAVVLGRARAVERAWRGRRGRGGV